MTKWIDKELLERKVILQQAAAGGTCSLTCIFHSRSQAAGRCNWEYSRSQAAGDCRCNWEYSRRRAEGDCRCKWADGEYAVGRRAVAIGRIYPLIKPWANSLHAQLEPLNCTIAECANFQQGSLKGWWQAWPGVCYLKMSSGVTEKLVASVAWCMLLEDVFRVFVSLKSWWQAWSRGCYWVGAPVSPVSPVSSVSSRSSRSSRAWIS